MNINLDSAKDTLCKNILIFGYCKFENKGCAFNHSTKPSGGPPQSQGSTATTSNTSNTTNTSNSNSNSISNSNNNSNNNSHAESKKKFNFNSPSFQPTGMLTISSKFSGASPKVKDIPVFIPSGGGGISQSEPPSAFLDSLVTDTVTSARRFNTSTPSFTPSNPYVAAPNESTVASPLVLQQLNKTPSNEQHNPYILGGMAASLTVTIQPPSSTDMFYQQPSTSYPLQYYLYAPAPPPRLSVPLPPHEINASLMFIPNDLRETLQKKNEATLQTLPRSTLPEHVSIYHSLVPIDTTFDGISKVYGVPSTIYKVFSNVDGNPYVFRRIDNHSIIRITNELPFRTIKRWRTVKCANVVQLQDAFTSMAFGGSFSSLVVAYDYFPNSNTLQEQHKNRKLGSKLEPINEEVLWNYLVEISNALTAIHDKGLAARASLESSKIIVTNKNRVRLASVGISDILNYEQDEAEIQQGGIAAFIEKLQQQDIVKFGRLMLELALLVLPISSRDRDTDPKDILHHLRESSTSIFSPEFVDVLTSLLYSTTNIKQFVKEKLALRVLSFANNAQDLLDFMESQLSTELENARLFRLCSKLNFIIDRPEYANDPDWQENGNKYIIKLFRDYVFFQYDEYGKPICDLSRVLINLNKLDAAIEEQILLVTTDEKNCIIVSYKEIRDIIDSVFRSLTRR